MKKIKLTQGKFALVDNEDYSDLIASGSWAVDGHGYAVRGVLKGGKRTIKMHRQIMGVLADRSIEIDHKDGNRLNNKKDNLRLCSHAENMRNMKMHKDNKVGLKGVSFCKATGKYKAQICVNGVNKNLGRYVTAKEAHKVYCDAAIEKHAEFSRFK